jgi:hypothetical protein
MCFLEWGCEFGRSGRHGPCHARFGSSFEFVKVLRPEGTGEWREGFRGKLQILREYGIPRLTPVISLPVNLKILSIAPALCLFACTGIQKQSEMGKPGGEDRGEASSPGFVERWTEESERRRAEGQYMGYYSKQAYYRALRLRSSHLASGH